MDKNETTAKKTCPRCQGRGDWVPGRVCFGCNGTGLRVAATAAVREARRADHTAEVRALVAELEAAIAAVETPLVSSRSVLERLGRDLATRRAQFVELGAAS